MERPPTFAVRHPTFDLFEFDEKDSSRLEITTN